MLINLDVPMHMHLVGVGNHGLLNTGYVESMNRLMVQLHLTEVMEDMMKTRDRWEALVH